MSIIILPGSATLIRDCGLPPLDKRPLVFEFLVDGGLQHGPVLHARNKRIFDLWLACHTQEEIAETVGCAKTQVNEVCSELANLPEGNKPAASHLTDFDPPLYNVWKQQERP